MTVIAIVQRQRVFTQAVSDEWWQRAPDLWMASGPGASR